MHPELLRALAKARHQDLLDKPRDPSASKSPTHVTVLRGSLVHDSGWAQCSFGQAHA